MSSPLPQGANHQAFSHAWLPCALFILIKTDVGFLTPQCVQKTWFSETSDSILTRIYPQLEIWKYFPFQLIDVGWTTNPLHQTYCCHCFFISLCFLDFILQTWDWIHCAPVAPKSTPLCLLTICSISLQICEVRGMGLQLSSFLASFPGFLIGIIIVSFQLTGTSPILPNYLWSDSDLFNPIFKKNPIM